MPKGARASIGVYVANGRNEKMIRHGLWKSIVISNCTTAFCHLLPLRLIDVLVRILFDNLCNMFNSPISELIFSKVLLISFFVEVRTH